MISRFQRCACDDSGASLILALVFMTFLGLVISSLLTYSGTSIRSTGATKFRADTVYDVDGALQSAVNQIRNSTYNNTGTPGECGKALTGSAATYWTFPGPNVGQNVAVSCDGGGGTGATGGLVPISDSNKPGSALLTLGTGVGGEPGIFQKSNNVLRVKGRVYSNSTVTASPGTLQVLNAQVIAKGACSGNVFSTPAPSCNDSTTDAAAGLDPAVAFPTAYAQPTAGLTYRPVPSCPSGSTVTFSPGYYDDAVALNDLMSTCSGRTFLFQPASGGGVGVYYFDFHNGEEAGQVPAQTQHVWNIADKNVRLVAGTPNGWDPDATPRQVPTIPGSCVSPLNTTANDGVQFVFGGNSQLSITKGQVEICGQYYSDRPPVAVYGAKSGADVTNGPVTAKTDGTGANTAGNLAFTNPANIKEVGGGAATVDLNGDGASGDTTASVTVQGFGTSPVIAPGSVLQSAKLVVVHRDDNQTSSDDLKSISLTVTPNPSRAGATALTGIGSPTLYKDRGSSAFHTDQIDITSALTTEVHSQGLSDLKVRYDVTVAKNEHVVENLDAIQLVTSWKPPAIRAETTSVAGGGNCVGTAPVSANCAVITTSGPDTAMYIQGTTYVPLAALDIFLNNVSGQVFKSGLIARSLQIQITASSGFPDPVIEVPDNSFGPRPVDVYFRAYICPGGSTCSAAPPAAPWRLSGTARVTYTDPSPGSPVAGDRRVNVRSWTMHR